MSSITPIVSGELLRQRRLAHARRIAAAPSDSLIDLAGDLADRRVLVLGGGGLLAELVATECRHAESARPGGRVVAGSADLVLVPECPAGETGAVLRQAATALARGGTVLIRLARFERDRAHEIRIALVLAGFRTVREAFSPTHRTIRAEALPH